MVCVNKINIPITETDVCTRAESDRQKSDRPESESAESDEGNLGTFTKYLATFTSYKWLHNYNYCHSLIQNLDIQLLLRLAMYRVPVLSKLLMRVTLVNFQNPALTSTA